MSDCSKAPPSPLSLEIERVYSLLAQHFLVHLFGFLEHAIEGELPLGFIAVGAVHQSLEEGKKLVYGELCITQNLV